MTQSQHPLNLPPMKLKYWTIQNGEVTPVSPLSRGLSSPEIQAATKGEATQILLSLLARIANAPAPRLWVKNGAYCLAYHNGNTIVVEGGSTHPRRANADGSLFPLVSGATDDMRNALKAASFDYYSSEGFSIEEKKAFGA